MDGVLVDSEPAITHAAMDALAEWGVDADYGEFKQYTGMGDDIFVGKVAEAHGVPYVTDMKARTYAIYGEKAHETVLLYPWSATLPKRLTEMGYRIAVASAADRIKVETNLRCIGVMPDLFDAVITGLDVERKKPAPDIFLKAAEVAGVDPVSCVVVEDAISGVKAAKAAGMTAVAVTTSFSRDKLISAGADRVTDDLAFLGNIIAEF